MVLHSLRPTQSWVQTRLGFRHWVPSRRHSPHRGTLVYGCRFFHLSPEIQLCFERTIKANCLPSQAEIQLLRRLWRWFYKVEGGVSLWTIATHRVLQSVVDCRMISFACLLDVKAPDRDSISNQVLQLQGEFAFCVFRKYLQWFGFPVLGVLKSFPRWHSLHCPLHNSPTRGSHSSRLILFPSLPSSVAFVSFTKSGLKILLSEETWAIAK